MTRINVGIKPQQLTDEHLRAEYREIQRLPSCYRKAVASGSINRIPDKPCLGKGHILFFLDKFFYTRKRHTQLYYELCDRDFLNAAFSGIEAFDDTEVKSDELWKDYTPTPEDTELLKARIIERITNSPKTYWHYRSKRISKERAIKLLD